MDEYVLRRLLIDAIRRLEQLFGPKHSLPLVLRWLFRLLGDSKLFFSGPLNLKTSVAENRIHIAWKKPEYVDPDWNCYRLRWYRSSNKKDQQMELSKEKTSASLRDVVPGDKYYICVTMGSTNGERLPAFFCNLPADSEILYPPQPTDKTKQDENLECGASAGECLVSWKDFFYISIWS